MNQASKEKGHQLWQAIQLSDQIAFDQFYVLYVKLLYNYGCQLTVDVGLVEDCIQELFIQLWQKRATLIFKSSIKNSFLSATVSYCFTASGEEAYLTSYFLFKRKLHLLLLIVL